MPLRSSILPFCAALAACSAPAHVGPVRDLPERARASLASAPPVYAPEVVVEYTVFTGP